MIDTIVTKNLWFPSFVIANLYLARCMQVHVYVGYATHTSCVRFVKSHESKNLKILCLYAWHNKMINLWYQHNF